MLPHAAKHMWRPGVTKAKSETSVYLRVDLNPNPSGKSQDFWAFTTTNPAISLHLCFS